MIERIFTLKKGTEVPAVFDGVTIPFSVPTTWAECLDAAGSEQNAVAIFVQAHALNVQKHVKSVSSEVDDKNVLVSTVESLRKEASGFKYGQVRVRGASTGTAKPSAAKVTAALGDDFLSTLTPEQRALYDSKMAALNVKPAAKPADVAAATTGTDAAPATPAATSGKKK